MKKVKKKYSLKNLRKDRVTAKAFGKYLERISFNAKRYRELIDTYFSVKLV